MSEESTLDPIAAAQKALADNAKSRIEAAAAAIKSIEEQYRVVFVPTCLISVEGGTPTFKSGIRIIPQ